LQSCKEYFFDKARDLGIDIHMIPGNHDTYFKNTNKVNSPELLLGEYDNIQIYPEVTELTFDERKILFVPWICSENYTHTMDVIKNTEAKAVFGHFEFSGFQMYKGAIVSHGSDTSPYSHFDLVCSGHYHHRSRTNNILYLGNPYEITWSDYEDPRGFNIYDTYDNSVEFLQNPFTIFHKFYFDDTSDDFRSLIADYDYDSIANSCVKVVVVKKSDFAYFDAFIDNLYQCNLIELKIIEDFSEFEDDAVGEVEVNLEDTMTLLNDYVDNVATDLDRDKLKSVLRTLYVEAQSEN
jgi:DNA repair exonuclease SbcCD nuclease subunit